MDDLLQNPESGECNTQRLTRGLPVAKWAHPKMQHPAMDLETGRKWPEGKSDHLPSD